MNEKSRSKGGIKHLQSLKEKNIHFQWEKDLMSMYILLHPSPSRHTFLKTDIAHNIFLPISKKFGHHRTYQTYCVFFSSSAPPQKMSRSYGTEK